MSRDRHYRGIAGYRVWAVWLVLMLSAGLCASATGAPARKSSPAGAGLYDVEASGTDVRFVLEALARQSGMNLVISPDVTGTISAHLRQMPLEDILNSLSAAHGFAWRKDGSAYIVSAKESGDVVTGEPVIHEVPPPPPVPEYDMLVWRCKHVKASDLITLLTTMFPSCKTVSGPSKVLPKLQEPMSSASNALGGNGAGSSSTSGSGSTSTGSNGSGSQGSDDGVQMVVLYGEAKELAKAKAAIEKVDVSRPQLAIEVAVTEISGNNNKDLGVTWSWNDVEITENAASGIAFGKFSKGAMTFTGTIAALAENGSAKLLAQPNIHVVDGGFADILIGDRILFPKLVGYTQFGTPIYDKEEERVGIYLQIAPRITEDDEVLLTLYPQVSLVTGYLKTQAGNYPQISTREARTTVSVKAGKTLAIGGLIRDNDIRTGSKIPLLGDLPIIGQLFRHNKTTKERTEIVIFLTPKIIDVEKGTAVAAKGDPAPVDTPTP